MMGQHVVSTRYLGQSIHTYVLLKPEWNTLVEGIIRNAGTSGEWVDVDWAPLHPRQQWTLALALPQPDL